MVHVLLYLSNIIGYLRIVLAAIGLSQAMGNHRATALCLGTSFLLDTVDGNVARTLNQTSMFGRVMDVTMDHVFLACITLIMAHLQPERMIIYLGIMSLDLLSNWWNTWSSCLVGHMNYKVVESPFALLNFYNQNQAYSMDMLVTLETVFWMALYISHFNKGPSLTIPWPVNRQQGLWRFLTLSTLPFVLLKWFINLLMLASAVNRVVNIHAEYH